MQKNLTRIKIKKKRKIPTIGICILYYHKTEYNYTYKRRSKGLY